jgi:hypothetical protein
VGKRVQWAADEEGSRIELWLLHGRNGEWTIGGCFNCWSRQRLWLQKFEALSESRWLRVPATNTKTPLSREAALFVNFPLTVLGGTHISPAPDDERGRRNRLRD